LLDAAVRVFAAGGVRAVTHRAVAAEAGLPLAATTYYFTSIDELMREAIRHHVATWNASLEQLTEASLGVVDLSSSDGTAALIGAVFAARDASAAGLELTLYLHATRDPELRTEAQMALRTFERLIATILRRAGLADPEPLVAAMTAQIAGVALRRQSHDDDVAEARHLAAALRGLLAAHVLGDAAVEDALARISGRSAVSR